MRAITQAKESTATRCAIETFGKGTYVLTLRDGNRVLSSYSYRENVAALYESGACWVNGTFGLGPRIRNRLVERA
jgi:hypothetical protein